MDDILIIVNSHIIEMTNVSAQVLNHFHYKEKKNQNILQNISFLCSVYKKKPVWKNHESEGEDLSSLSKRNMTTKKCAFST